MGATVSPMPPRAPKPPDPVDTAFAAVLRDLRRERGLSQERLAELVDSGATFVSQVERGERGVTLRWVFRVADALGVDPEHLASAVDARRKRA